jgi:hypothetical protein
MKFSTREIYFLKDAVEYRIQSYEKLLKSDKLTDDESSDIINDKGVLEVLLNSLKEALSNKTTGMIVRLQDTNEYLLSTKPFAIMLQQSDIYLNIYRYTKVF